MARLGRRAWWALGALVLGVVTVGLDITVLNVALPTIGADLGAGTGALQWMVNAYVLVFAGLMLPLAALGDRYGRKRLLLVGLVVFGVASAAAAWAPSSSMVVAARAGIGVGAAIVIPISLATVTTLFPDPAQRAKAISVVIAGTGVGVPLGPIVGGWLLGRFWWGSVFLVNVPVAVLALAAVAVLLPESRDPTPAPADWVGAGLAIAGLVSLAYGVIAAPDRGWADGLVLGALTAGVVLLAGFVRWERRARFPRVELRLFTRRRFLWGTLAAAVAGFALLGLLFVLPPVLQLVRGEDALGTGIQLLPMIGGLVVGAAVGQRLAARAGPRWPVSAGLLLLAAGLGAGAAASGPAGGETAGWLLAGWLAAAGAGVGLALAPATDALLSELPPERAGSGTALAMTIRYVGGAFGVALLGSLLAQSYAGRLDTSGLPAPAAMAAEDSLAGALAVAARLGAPDLAAAARDAFTHGTGLVLAACAAVALAGAALTAAALPSAAIPARTGADTSQPIS